MNTLFEIVMTIRDTVVDVLPIATIVVVFQIAVLRQPLPNIRRLIVGFVYVLVGLSLFLAGLEKALFPIGRLMATQLTDLRFILDDVTTSVPEWPEYYWVYLFAFCIGASTTIAEPALMAVAIKASQVSGGAISAWGLRLAVALGVALGIALGTWRIVVGIPIQYFIIPGYIFVVIQTYFAPKMIVPLAYDSGGVTTSTVTVPLVAALGLGLADSVPGRDPLLDGFGLIAFASLFPMITVMGYAQGSAWWTTRRGGDAEPSNRL
ncbi:MAG: DUF1538 domain-containing protein [Arenicellales bacterium]|nr:DUF1538 domain-containing protein [Arenicellales bacterium]